jgi:hypothetical protein
LLTFKTQTGKGEKMDICPNGHGNKEHQYCDKCGAKLLPTFRKKESPPPSISAIKRDPYKICGHKKCPGCNYELKHGHQRFCPGCGHPLKWTCR